MSIKKHLGNLAPTIDQLNAIDLLDQFLLNDTPVFVLKGYAGSGKTTLLRGLIDYLISSERRFQLMAPTGRAAKIIHQRTGYIATTIHKGIYNFDKLEHFKNSEENERGDFRYYFKLRANENSYQKVFIVDEASMLSNHMSHGEFLRFGSGHLLQDLITFTRVNNVSANSKIIFIGDDAQLPPVGMSFSPALDPNYLLKQFNLNVNNAELREVKRQNSDSGILNAANKLRTCLTSGFFNEFDLRDNKKDIINVSYDNFLETYFSSRDHRIIITFKNKTAQELNNLIRERKFGINQQIRSSDKVIIGSNNYNLGILNGELAVVTSVGEIETIRTVKFYGSEGKSVEVTLRWREIELIAPDENGQDKNVKGLMLENSLFGDNFLTVNEMQALLVDFKNRNKHLKPETIEFNEALKNDAFFNCIQLKYGYAITCHKAQGGEWDEVFVFWDKGNKLNFNFLIDFQLKLGKQNEEYYRWAYTAITRASKNLYVVNPPFFNSYSNMVFVDSSISNSYQEITKIDIKPIELDFSDEFIAVIKEFQLEESPLEIQDHFIKLHHILGKHFIDIVGWKKVNLEIRYFFKRVEELVAIKFWINGKNEFNKNFMILPQSNDSKELFEKIKTIIDQSQSIVLKRERSEAVLTKVQFEIEMEENQPFLLSLYNAFKTLISDKNLNIIKIDHFPYRERYYFERETEKAVVDFVYDKQGNFGTVVPVDNASNSQDLIFEVNNLIDELKTSPNVI
jgi:hypothetical protein